MNDWPPVGTNPILLRTYPIPCGKTGINWGQEASHFVSIVSPRLASLIRSLSLIYSVRLCLFLTWQSGNINRRGELVIARRVAAVGRRVGRYQRRRWRRRCRRREQVGVAFAQRAPEVFVDDRITHSLTAKQPKRRRWITMRCYLDHNQTLPTSSTSTPVI